MSLRAMAKLRPSVDVSFDKVTVNADDKALRAKTGSSCLTKSAGGTRIFSLRSCPCEFSIDLNMTNAPVSRPASEFWAITAYFNPVRYSRRLTNYRLFRERLGLPLVAVELAYGPDFELDETDADIVVRLRGADILWQKERLLDLALRSLPDDCRKVAWVDSDIIFDSSDWIERSRSMLDRFPLIQPFSHAYRMPSNWTVGDGLPPDVGARRSVPYIIASGTPIAACLGSPATRIHSAPGYIWAADRTLLDRHGLYDACIVGGAPVVIACAAYGFFDGALQLQPLNKDHYLEWAVPFHAAVRGNVGFVEGKLYHLWHGDFVNRKYRARQEELRNFRFDPFSDVAVDEQGVWRWNSEKPEMHKFISDYFFTRKEDG
jgi:hypothetical protein